MAKGTLRRSNDGAGVDGKAVLNVSAQKEYGCWGRIDRGGSLRWKYREADYVRWGLKRISLTRYEIGGRR